MGLIEDIRNIASRGVLYRTGVYVVGTVLVALLVSVLATLFRLPTAPPYMVLFSIVFLVAMFYFVDPENEYTLEDIIAVFLAAVSLTVLMELFGLASQVTLIKQYAAPLVYMQEAAEGMTSALGVSSTDVLGTLLLNIWAWLGGLSLAMGIKVLITERSA